MYKTASAWTRALQLNYLGKYDYSCSLDWRNSGCPSGSLAHLHLSVHTHKCKIQAHNKCPVGTDDMFYPDMAVTHLGTPFLTRRIPDRHLTGPFLEGIQTPTYMAELELGDKSEICCAGLVVLVSATALRLPLLAGPVLPFTSCRIQQVFVRSISCEYASL
jgi:hypothetical protein